MNLRYLSPLAMRGREWKHVGHQLFGSGPEIDKMTVMNSAQKKYLKDILGQLRGQNINLNQQPLYQQGSDYLSNLLSGSPESTSAFEAPAMRQFNEQIMPQIAEQFAGVGGLSSSGFQNAAAGAGAGLAERLQQLRSSLQYGGASQALGYAQAPATQAYNFGSLGLGKIPFGYNQTAGQPGLLGGATQGLGALLPLLMM